MAKSSKRWLQAQQRDPYVKQARQSDYRSRAVYKLEEIDQRYRLFRTGQVVVDLGAAPGSWSQYASRHKGAEGSIVAVDILPMEPIDGVEFIQGDFTETDVFEKCLESLHGARVDLVISDMAPNLTGIKSTDQARSMYLVELVLDFARQVLKPGGTMLVKLFQGEGTDTFRKELSKEFQKVTACKPKASRDNSREFYVLAQVYKV